ncbi:MAG: putative lipoic acid-binding regulatory protein [Bacteroidia bacterium]|jgi:putative lipoic acid-binding regulatory protein
MQEQDPPKIEFPCEYPIKVLGRSSENFHAMVLEIFQRHAPSEEPHPVAGKSSSKGTFTSLTVTIIATGPDQLKALHEDLMATGHVKMVI